MPLLGDAIIGFLDETSLQLDPNKIRVINTPEITYKLGKIRRKTIFGFMALNGNSVAMASDTSKKEDMLSFINLIKKHNPLKHIIIILDNARIHHAKIVTELLSAINITFVYLPPYSPKLNPIEYANKDIKSELAKILEFEKMIEKSEDVAHRFFEERKFSYTKSWRDKFIISEVICRKS